MRIVKNYCTYIPSNFFNISTVYEAVAILSLLFVFFPKEPGDCTSTCGLVHPTYCQKLSWLEYRHNLRTFNYALSSEQARNTLYMHLSQ